jgi:hypothetical protein
MTRETDTNTNIPTPPAPFDRLPANLLGYAEAFYYLAGEVERRRRRGRNQLVRAEMMLRRALRREFGDHALEDRYITVGWIVELADRVCR